MAVKFECPKCGRRFAEWGAEKMGFHCPVDEFCPKDANEDIKFVKAGSAEGGKSPSLKRRAKKVAPVAAPVEAVEEDVIVPDIEDIDEPDDDIEEEVEVEEEIVIDEKVAVVVGEDLEVVVPDDEEVEEGEVADLDFEEGDAETPADAEPEAAAEDEWA